MSYAISSPSLSIMFFTSVLVNCCFWSSEICLFSISWAFLVKVYWDVKCPLLFRLRARVEGFLLLKVPFWSSDALLSVLMKEVSKLLRLRIVDGGWVMIVGGPSVCFFFRTFNNSYSNSWIFVAWVSKLSIVNLVIDSNLSINRDTDVCRLSIWDYRWLEVGKVPTLECCMKVLSCFWVVY